MQTTNIEWTEMSVNPFRARSGAEDGTLHVGHYCEKVSAGCANCYASAMQVRFQMPTFPEARRAMPEIYLDEAKLMEVLRRRKPTKIFWCDMTDMFAEFYPDEWIDKCFAVMALTPQHTHQLLTKRPERMLRYCALFRPPHVRSIRIMRWMKEYGGGESLTLPLPNVWLGVSVEDQKTADERIPLLLQTPAAVRWISAEPLLGPVDLRKWRHREYSSGYSESSSWWQGDLDWVVVGGESGPHARPFNIQWARDIIAQCKAAGVACFVKQLGSNARMYVSVGEDQLARGVFKFTDRKGGDPSEWPEDLRVREFPEVAR